MTLLSIKRGSGHQSDPPLQLRTSASLHVAQRSLGVAGSAESEITGFVVFLFMGLNNGTFRGFDAQAFNLSIRQQHKKFDKPDFLFSYMGHQNSCIWASEFGLQNIVIIELRHHSSYIVFTTNFFHPSSMTRRWLLPFSIKFTSVSMRYLFSSLVHDLRPASKPTCRLCLG